MSESKDEGYWDSLSISEIARLLHVPQSTLRYYEDEGLVTPVRTESGGWRQYSLLSLVELGDILFYRSIGIPVKDIKGLMESPVKETASAVDRAIADTVEQMQGLGKTLERLSLYNRRIREFYMVQARGSRLVDKPEVDVLYPFGMKEESSLQAYLDDLATSYCFFIEDASSPDAYVDCASKPTEATESEPVWKSGGHEGRYYECLVRTDYCYAQRNDVARHVERIRALGLEPGAVIAQYLTFDYSEEEGKRYDYYHAWIEVR
ncbi:MerR family transcriptional regulator [Arabiibacter massiliensis]|uniref:MerR family transcriptional regulator n=1 Tax=Arabiibacter massiliensis TaxID=1870985 RepID=UPI0009BC3861|nr:MerR family transcriptional regulator [Arabiibacter massiliensis]